MSLAACVAGATALLLFGASPQVAGAAATTSTAATQVADPHRYALEHTAQVAAGRPGNSRSASERGSPLGPRASNSTVGSNGNESEEDGNSIKATASPSTGRLQPRLRPRAHQRSMPRLRGQRSDALWLAAFGPSVVDGATRSRFNRAFPASDVTVVDRDVASVLLFGWAHRDTFVAFHKLSHDVMRADLFKYAAMCNAGGYYMDLKAGFKSGKDVGCLKKLSNASWFASNAVGVPTTWNMFAVAGSPIHCYVEHAIAKEVVRGRIPRGERFEEKVWDTTGPRALLRHLKGYGELHGTNYRDYVQNSESACLVYDVRGAGASWGDAKSYHKMPDSKPVYLSHPRLGAWSNAVRILLATAK